LDSVSETCRTMINRFDFVEHRDSPGFPRHGDVIAMIDSILGPGRTSDHEVVWSIFTPTRVGMVYLQPGRGGPDRATVFDSASRGSGATAQLLIDSPWMLRQLERSLRELAGHTDGQQRSGRPPTALA
jgi:hypothetical protein